VKLRKVTTGCFKLTPTKSHHDIPKVKIKEKKVQTIEGAQMLYFGAKGFRKRGKMKSRV